MTVPRPLFHREVLSDDDLCMTVVARDMILSAIAKISLISDDGRKALGTNLRALAGSVKPAERPMLLTFAEFAEKVE